MNMTVNNLEGGIYETPAVEFTYIDNSDDSK